MALNNGYMHGLKSQRRNFQGTSFRLGVLEKEETDQRHFYYTFRLSKTGI